MTNAHIRGKTPGAKQLPPAPDTVTQIVSNQLLNDPEFNRACQKVRMELVSRIESGIPGNDVDIELEREYCRSLRTLQGIRRALAVAGQMETLKEHNFRASAAEK